MCQTQKKHKILNGRYKSDYVNNNTKTNDLNNSTRGKESDWGSGGARSKYMPSIGDMLYIQRYKKTEYKQFKKIHQANNTHKKAGVVILVSDKISFKTK